MRVPQWERKLKAVIEKHMALPSQYGVSDCFIIPDDIVEAITGEHIDVELLGYTNEIGAAKKLLQHGFNTVEDIFTARFERVSPSLAQRGDIGVILNAAGEVCGGGFTSLGFMTRDQTNVVFLPSSSVKSAFKVGR